MADRARDLGLELAQATRAAATAAARLHGCRDPNAVDQAAVDALRAALDAIDFTGHVVIGEGEKDRAPMLAAGERVGRGAHGQDPTGLHCDLAVDPVDGTRCVAEGRPGALVAVAAAPRHALTALPGYYARKLAVGPALATLVRARTLELADDLEPLLRRFADALARPPVIAVLDRPRNDAVRDAVRRAGATLRLLADADLSATVAAALPEPDADIDALAGIGGCPEAVIASCAIACLNGHIICQPWRREQAAPSRVYSLPDIVRGGPRWFVATGVTGCELVAPGVTVIIDAAGVRRLPAPC